jgi:hypothetical protein
VVDRFGVDEPVVDRFRRLAAELGGSAPERPNGDPRYVRSVRSFGPVNLEVFAPAVEVA